MKSDKQIIKSILDKAGITIDGDKPYDIQVHNDAAYGRILRQGVLGLGESYMEGWWDCPNLDQFFDKVFTADLEKQIQGNWDIVLKVASKYVLNAGRKSKAFKVGQKHYDIGNDLYRIMLDKRMTYTSGYWQYATTLDDAQLAKLDLVCR